MDRYKYARYIHARIIGQLIRSFATPLLADNVGADSEKAKLLRRARSHIQSSESVRLVYMASMTVLQNTTRAQGPVHLSEI